MSYLIREINVRLVRCWYWPWMRKWKVLGNHCWSKGWHVNYGHGWSRVQEKK